MAASVRAPQAPAVPGLLLAQALPPVGATAALWAAGGDAGWPHGALLALCIGGVAAASAALLSPRRKGRAGWAVAGAALWTAACGCALGLAFAWGRGEPAEPSALPGWLLRGLPSAGLGVLLLAAGGLLFGRLAAGRPLRSAPDPVHWLLGTCLLGLPAVALGVACALAGPWPARAAAALLASAAGAFWPAWAAAEPAGRPSTRVRYRLRDAGVLPRPRPRVELGGAGRVPRRTAEPAGGPPPRRGRRQGRRWRWRPQALWAQARRAAHGGALPVTVRVVSARTSAARLLALYAYGGLCSGPALLLLLLGARAAEVWLAPARLGPAGLGLVLGTDAAVLLACVGLALRSGLVHHLELTLPRPRALPAVLAGLAALLALRFGGPGWGAALGHGVAGALVAAHAWPVLLVFCLVLPVVQAAFFFGLMQTRLGEVRPAWESAVLPAAALAVSGPLTGVPLPALLPAFLLGLVLAWTRQRAGAATVALALGAANLAALELLLAGR